MEAEKKMVIFELFGGRQIEKIAWEISLPKIIFSKLHAVQISGHCI